MRYWLAAIAALGFLNFSEPAKADVLYWAFFGEGSCGTGPGCSQGITTVQYEGDGSLTLGKADGPGFDVTSFTGDIFELGGGFGADFHVTSANSLTGAPLIFDPDPSNGALPLPNGLVIPGAVSCSPAGLCQAHDFLGATNVNDSVGGFEFSETPFAIGPVPEPSTWVMLLIGFVGIGVLTYFAPRRASA
jgi:hypothetical protein